MNDKQGADFRAAGAAKKPRGRPFQPGQSGNPDGGPKGARAPVYAALDAAAAEHMPEIMRALVEKAKEGDPRAAELLMRRAWPERKGRPLSFALPVTAGAAGLAEAMGAVTEAMATGAMTPDEASAVAGVIEIHRKAIVTEDHEQRLKALEEGKA